MAKDGPKTSPKTTAARSGSRARRKSVRRDQANLLTLFTNAIQSPRFVWALGVWVVFTVVCGSLAIWARQQPLVAVDRVMTETRTVRVPFAIENLRQTEDDREQARQKTPPVFVAQSAALEEIQASLENLPRTLAAVESIDLVAPEIREQFHLTEAGLRAIKDQAIDGEPRASWLTSVRELISSLQQKPLLDMQDWQVNNIGPHTEIELRIGEEKRHVLKSAAVNVGDEEMLGGQMLALAWKAQFAAGPLRELVVSRLTANPRPTFRPDSTATRDQQDAAAAAVSIVIKEHPVGETIFTPGQVLDQASYELYKEELRRFQADAENWRVWLRRLSLFGTIAAIGLAVAAYAGLFVRRIRRNPSRMIGLAGLLCGMLAVACLATAADPRLFGLSIISPVVFAAIILVIAYDQRTALAFGGALGVMVCIALDQTIGVFSIMLAGVAVAAWAIKEIRDRRTLIRLGMYEGATLAAGMLLIGLIERPLTDVVIRQNFIDAGLAGFGGLLAAGVTVFILPTIEKVFDITTGMTLIELRDPKNTLLRKLLQAAPGTYNHSLNVASIAEAASDAIGADALQTYVGALYHDIGKMNKPDYFVENQTGGPSKHEKLSPAMSLLVIVGHVKDGVEMAREYGLPRSLHHFIEAHHGTTLVEYFYDLAKRQAAQAAQEGKETDAPVPIEYCYPGPKPRTKEVAIIMLADAMESATRTMSEPTPSRIDTLARQIAQKRLMAGQFDECELTLRELNTIVESISKSVASIYHGRIAYPSGTDTKEKVERRA